MIGLMGAGLLALRPVWARSYGAGAARHMIATRVGWVAVAVGVWLPVGMLPSERFFDALVWLGPLLVVGTLLVTEHRRRKLGPVLVRMPRVHTQWVFLVTGAVQLLVALLTFRPRAPTIALVPACLGIFFIGMALRRYEFRERGLATLESAWPWREVEYFDWVGRDRGTLHLRLYWTWWFRSSGVLPVPADQHETVARILHQHAPHAEPTTGCGRNDV
jgi:hypothetical protein